MQVAAGNGGHLPIRTRPETGCGLFEGQVDPLAGEQDVRVWHRQAPGARWVSGEGFTEKGTGESGSKSGQDFP
jgi:hypothetical protein